MRNHRVLSIMIVPHHGGRQRTLRLSRKHLRTVAGVTVGFFILLTVFIVDYFSMGVTRNKYRELQAETEKQKQSLAEYQENIEKLTAYVTSYETYAKKLNVMAGLQSSEELREVGGLGAGPDRGQNVPGLDLQNIGQSPFPKLEERASLVQQDLNTLLVHFQADVEKLASTPSIWPTKGYLSSHFGYRDDPFTGQRTMHWGLDIVTNPGNPVWAPADGRVIFCRNAGTGGKTIKIAHMGGVTTVFCHLSQYKVKEGQKIKRGQVIGLVGSTGRSRGPHLHYEVLVNNVRKNPRLWILEN